MRGSSLSNQGFPNMPEERREFDPAGVSRRREGPVTVVSIARPAVRNAVDPATALALYEAMLAFEADEESGAAVLSGAEDCFCAGFDLNALASGEADAWLDRLHFGKAGRPPLGPMGPTRLRLSKPVVAAIEGPAVAGGMELALWCDLRVMARDAWMGVLCRRWGVPLIDGGTVRLPRLVGTGRALDLVLTGRRIEAQECLDIGLCERLAEPGGTLQAAVSLAAELCAFPQACLHGDRDALRAAVAPDELAAMQAEFLAGLRVLRRQGREGAARFAAGAGRHGAPDPGEP
jgi:enoyl-CoA hydratase